MDRTTYTFFCYLVYFLVCNLLHASVIVLSHIHVRLLLDWWSGAVVSALASINEVNLCQAQLVLRWATVSRFNSRCQTSISVCNQPATQGQLSPPTLRWLAEYQFRLGRRRQVWFIPLAYERGVCSWNCEIPWERVPYLSALQTTRRYTNPRLPYLTLPWILMKYQYQYQQCGRCFC